MVQDRKAFGRIVEESSDSALAMLGGLSGLAGELKLTTSRMALLEGVLGTLHFEVTGDDGFALLTHFGPEPIPDEPTTSIRVSPEGYEELKSGALDPQNAFLTGRIVVEGDMQLAMQLALAALTPD